MLALNILSKNRCPRALATVVRYMSSKPDSVTVCDPAPIMTCDEIERQRTKNVQWGKYDFITEERFSSPEEMMNKLIWDRIHNNQMFCYRMKQKRDKKIGKKKKFRPPPFCCDEV